MGREVKHWNSFLFLYCLSTYMSGNLGWERARVPFCSSVLLWIFGRERGIPVVVLVSPTGIRQLTH